MNQVIQPTEDHSVVHIDESGYECGGPHYRTPWGGDGWAWCEPTGVWLLSQEADNLTDRLAAGLHSALLDPTVSGREVGFAALADYETVRPHRARRVLS